MWRGVVKIYSKKAKSLHNIFRDECLSDYEKAGENPIRKIFSVKLAPCGLTIIDIKREGK